MIEISVLPTIEAFCNFCALISMYAGLYFIKSGEENKHKISMFVALFFSAVFLICYLVYHATVTEEKKYLGEYGLVYYPILITHIILAAAVPFLIIKTVYHAMRDQREPHKKWAKITFPIWSYVSVTGIIVYYMVHR